MKNGRKREFSEALLLHIPTVAVVNSSAHARLDGQQQH